MHHIKHIKLYIIMHQIIVSIHEPSNEKIFFFEDNEMKVRKIH